MTILDKLSDREAWEEFKQYKTAHNQLSKREINELEVFLCAERYRTIGENLRFSYPKKKIITKLNSSRKRTVYSYGPDETWVLKLLAFLLYRYDSCLCDNCYSFRRNVTAKTAFDRIMQIPDLSGKTVLKVDIHDYFNSIDVDRLLPILNRTIDDDPQLLDFLTGLLRQDRCIWNGEVIEEKRGAMAGVPLASFLANIYLAGLDEMFKDKNYFRYSDDIIVFCEDERETGNTRQLITDHLEEMGLVLNEEKTCVFFKGEPWSFLGFKYENGEIDLSDVTVKKMKGKIKRKAARLYRNRLKNDVEFEKAARSLIRSFDNKFYDLTGNNDFTWTRFYFPVITTDKGLHEIDEYFQQYLRYLYSGRHYKGNYKVSYSQLKKLGYTPLVREYHNWIKENSLLDRQNRKAKTR